MAENARKCYTCLKNVKSFLFLGKKKNWGFGVDQRVGHSEEKIPGKIIKYNFEFLNSSCLHGFGHS